MTNLIAEIGKVLPKSRVAKSSLMRTKVTTTLFSGFGMNAEELEGIIEKYYRIDPWEPVEEFDVYTDGHPNAVIYEAIKEYVDENNVTDNKIRSRLSYLFWAIYKVARDAQNCKDLWVYSGHLEEDVYKKTFMFLYRHKTFNHDLGIEEERYTANPYAESIVTGAVIFLLSNLPNVSSRFRRDVAKLEQRYVKDKGNVPSFLPYLWKAIEEAPLSQAVLEDEIAPEIGEGFVPTILEECEQEPLQEVDQTSCANNENTHALKTCIFISKEVEEKWANIIKQFIADNITAPLDGSMKNPTLAMIHHFYTKWQTQNRLLRAKIKAQDVLDFFIQKCGVKKKIQKNGEPVKDKTITNKIDGLKSKSNKLNDTPEITKIEVAIKKVWKTYTCTK